MPLINLVNETKLRSIPFGNDKPDGGSSNQPFIKLEIPRVDQPRPLNFKDSFIRGGFNGALKSSIQDFFRLSKYFTGVDADLQSPAIVTDFEFGYGPKGVYEGWGFDFKKGKTILPELTGDIQFQNPIKRIDLSTIDGIIFASKQLALNRTGVYIKDDYSRIYTPASTLANSLGNAFGFHFQKEGLNPLKGLLGGYYNLGSKATGYYSTTYNDGNQVLTPTPPSTFLQLSSLLEKPDIDPDNFNLDNPDISKIVIEDAYFIKGEYLEYGTPNIEITSGKSYLKAPTDRSTIYKNKLTLLYQTKINPFPSDFKKSIASNLYNIPTNDDGSLIKYSGGPSSFLGIGKTNIRMIGIGYGFQNENTFSESFTNSEKYKLNQDQNIYTWDHALLGFTNISRPSSVARIVNNVTKIKSGIKLSDFRSQVNGYYSAFNTKKSLTFIDPLLNNEPVKKVIPSTGYNYFNRDQTFLQKVEIGKKLYNYLSPNSSLFYDFVNATSEIRTSKELNSAIEELKYKDIIKFNFEVINNDDRPNDMLFFRAYVNSMTDNYKSEWNSYKYVGRAENLYKYSSFNRDGQMSFSIYAHSRAEMRFLYRKLNLLVATTAPSYSSIGMMRGNIVRMTIGDYYNETPVIINNISLKPNFDAGWDIDRDDNGVPFQRPEDVRIQESLVGDTTIVSVKKTDTIQTTLGKRTEDLSAIYTGPIIDESDNTLSTRGTWVGQLPRMIDVDISFTVLHDFAPRYDSTANNLNFIANQTTKSYGERSSLEFFSNLKEGQSTNLSYQTGNQQGVVFFSPTVPIDTVTASQLNYYYYYYSPKNIK